MATLQILILSFKVRVLVPLPIICPVSSGGEQVPYKDKVVGAKPTLGTKQL